MKVRKVLLGAVVAWGICFSAVFGAVAAELPLVRVGVVTDGPSDLNALLFELTQREVATLTEGEFDVRFPAEAVREADWTAAGVEAELWSLLEDPEIDVVLTWGLLASHVSCCARSLPKPVIAPVIIDVELQGLPVGGPDGGSGVGNLNYVALPDNTLSELKTFREIVQFEKIAFLANAALLEVVPELVIRSREAGAEIQVEVSYVAVGDSVAEALAAIPEDVDAVYVWPLGHLSQEEVSRLVDGLIERRLPSFSALGGADVEAGVLASLGSEEFFPRLVRRAALNLQRILLGEAPESIPVAFSVRERLTLNMATARAIDVSPRWEMLLEAELIHPEQIEGVRRVSLDSVVKEAVNANLDLAVQERAVSAGEQEVARARSQFLPQIDFSALGVQIDEDRAANSFGAQSERSLTGSLSLSQLIYSDAARANLEVQQWLQASRSEVLKELRLDIALEAAETYLNLLRAKTLTQVRRDNLEITRQNLDLAKVRREIGAANPAEVYRWESSIAADRAELVAANSQVQSAEVALNRLLHRSLEESFLTEEVDLDDPVLITGQDRFSGYIETPRQFRVLRDFAVSEGLASAPELQQLLQAIEAQKRLVRANERVYYLPTVGLQATLDELLGTSGAGSDLPSATDDTNWSVGINASLPLFQGGARKAELVQAREELAQLELQWESAMEKIEQRIRSASIATRASFTTINLSEQAANAARKNLELVADSYARGAVSILDLLDAQDAALNADLGAANAVYDFLVDLMNIQRASNQFDFFVSPEARTAWFERLDLFFAQAGVDRWRSVQED